MQITTFNPMILSKNADEIIKLAETDAETDNIASISENLNKYSDEINSDLSQYTV